VPLLAEFPANARALAGVIELVLTALAPSRSDTVIETGAGIGAYTLHLALAAGRAVGVTTRPSLDAARANARDNRLENCGFYTRDAVRALQKAARADRVRLAFLRPDGTGLGPELAPALRAAGVERVAYLGRSLRLVGADADALQAAGYRVLRAKPVDTSPHTSRVGILLVAEAG
jgi:23S rRNA (uracil1939-C5)-methyltransferase